MYSQGLQKTQESTWGSVFENQVLISIACCLSFPCAPHSISPVVMYMSMIVVDLEFNQLTQKTFEV